MIFFKACPKCQGDLYFDRDVYGLFFKCIQCGFMKDSTTDREEDANVAQLTT